MFHWKVAISRSPLNVAFKQLEHGFLLREADGKATFYMYKDFPLHNRPALEEEMTETGWTPLLKPLLTAWTIK